MAQKKQDWDDLGRSIQDIVDRAVNSRDYQKLNQTICQTVEKAIDMGSEAVRKAMDGVSKPSTGSGYHGTERPNTVQQKKLPALYGSTGGKMATGVLKTVGGGILSFFTLLGFLSSAIVHLLITKTSLVTFPVVMTLAGFGVGIGLICSGVGTLTKISRFKTYQKTLGQKTYCTLDKLARSVGKSVQFVSRELRSMIDQRLFLEGHLNKEETCLITSDETYQYFEQSRLQLEKQREAAAREAREKARAKEAAPPVNSQVQEVLDRGNAFIAQIRKCNDDIPGEEISEKISRMEMIVRRIFERAEAHPEIVPDLKKLMDYYLPMTVKLLNAYAEMDAQPIQGENIENSKREIEATLDTLNLAFEKLLDDLFKDTAMDVSSDISVLQTLLAQEGLTEDDFTKTKKQETM